MQCPLSSIIFADAFIPNIEQGAGIFKGGIQFHMAQPSKIAAHRAPAQDVFLWFLPGSVLVCPIPPHPLLYEP